MTPSCTDHIPAGALSAIQNSSMRSFGIKDTKPSEAQHKHVEKKSCASNMRFIRAIITPGTLLRYHANAITTVQVLELIQLAKDIRVRLAARGRARFRALRIHLALKRSEKSSILTKAPASPRWDPAFPPWHSPTGGLTASLLLRHFHPRPFGALGRHTGSR